MSLWRACGVSQEPVCLQEIKDYLRVDDPAEDALLEQLIQVARQFVENYTGRSLLTQQWQLELAAATASSPSLLTLMHGRGVPHTIPLLRGPVQRVEEVTILYPTSPQRWPLSSADYSLSHGDGWARLSILPLQSQAWEQISVRYTTGYGDRPQDVPEILRHAIFMQSAFLYENRGDQQKTTSLPESLCSLLQPYKIPYFHNPSLIW